MVQRCQLVQAPHSGQVVNGALARGRCHHQAVGLAQIGGSHPHAAGLLFVDGLEAARRIHALGKPHVVGQAVAAVLFEQGVKGVIARAQGLRVRALQVKQGALLFAQQQMRQLVVLGRRRIAHAQLEHVGQDP